MHRQLAQLSADRLENREPLVVEELRLDTHQDAGQQLLWGRPAPTSRVFRRPTVHRPAVSFKV
jgi:hypothetical protein